MSCWVVPTIAAEIWGVSVDSVLARVRDGSLAQRHDEGFMFVDVQPPAPRTIERPSTFTVLSAAEVEALARDAEASSPLPLPLPEAEPIASVHDDDEESQSPGNDEASIELGDWRASRRRTGMTRIPPGRSAKPQAA